MLVTSIFSFSRNVAKAFFTGVFKIVWLSVNFTRKTSTSKASTDLLESEMIDLYIILKIFTDNKLNILD